MSTHMLLLSLFYFQKLVVNPETNEFIRKDRSAGGTVRCVSSSARLANFDIQFHQIRQQIKILWH